MTAAAFAKIPEGIDIVTLYGRVKRVFSNIENDAYFCEIMQRKNEDGIKESLSVLLVLSELLGHLSIDASALIFKRQESGKPYFLGSPIELSLSHSKSYVAAVISDSSRVGIDIEATDVSRDKGKKLAKRFFSEDEERELCAHPEDFLKIWTKKEAYAKMRGISLSDLIASEKKSAADIRKDVFSAVFEADGYPVTVCLENADKITDFYEIFI